MAENGMFIANRDVKVLTNKGYAFDFKKDTPVFVPPLVREEMLAYGILPVNDDLPLKTPEETKAEPIGAERVTRIYDHVVKIIEANRPADFTAGGVPREDAFFREAGFNAARRELNAAYKKYLAERSTAEE